jgi:hypothetical protein
VGDAGDGAVGEVQGRGLGGDDLPSKALITPALLPASHAPFREKREKLAVGCAVRTWNGVERAHSAPYENLQGCFLL